MIFFESGLITDDAEMIADVRVKDVEKYLHRKQRSGRILGWSISKTSFGAENVMNRF